MIPTGTASVGDRVHTSRNETMNGFTRVSMRTPHPFNTARRGDVTMKETLRVMSVRLVRLLPVMPSAWPNRVVTGVFDDLVDATLIDAQAAGWLAPASATGGLAAR